tara:strand:+ start:1955 stop:3475 length:1521 start_codon:yes stop_codon:yes gene_type:complete
MANLTEVVEQLKAQNNTLESVNSTVVAMLKEDIDARKATLRGKGKAEEDRRERAKVRNQPNSIVGGFKQGAAAGLGLGALSGLLGLIGGGLATIFKALVPGFIAAATTKSILTAAATGFGKLLGRTFLIGILATWGQTIFKKFLDSIDPEDGSIFDISDEAKTKFAGLLNFATMGLLVAGMFGKLISFKFRALLAGGIVVGGFLYNALMDKLDGSVLEEKFNENFNIDFGAEIMSGLGALVGVALSGAILNTIRKRLGLTVKSVMPASKPDPGFRNRGINRTVTPTPANTNAAPKVSPGKFNPLKFTPGGLIRSLLVSMGGGYVASKSVDPLTEFLDNNLLNPGKDFLKGLGYTPPSTDPFSNEGAALFFDYFRKQNFTNYPTPEEAQSLYHIDGNLNSIKNTPGYDNIDSYIAPRIKSTGFGGAMNQLGARDLYINNTDFHSMVGAARSMAESAAVSAAAAVAAAEKVAAPDRSVANAGFSGGREAAIGNTSDNNDKFHEALGIE